MAFLQTLFAVLLGGVLAPLGNYILQRASQDFERKKTLRQKELDKVCEFRDLAGYLTCVLTEAAFWKRKEEAYTKQFDRLYELAGNMRYLAPYGAMKRFIASAASVVVDEEPESGASRGEQSDSRKQLDEAYAQLVAACQQELARRG